MGYSMVAASPMLRALSPRLDGSRARRSARAAILVYPDCALAECLGTQARRSPADPVRHGRARRLDARFAMPGGDRPGRAGPAIDRDPHLRGRAPRASTRSACRCAISRTSAIAASLMAAAGALHGANEAAWKALRGRRAGVLAQAFAPVTIWHCHVAMSLDGKIAGRRFVRLAGALSAHRSSASRPSAASLGAPS